MKKILIFSLTYHPFVGGAEIAIKEITDRISPDEFEFHMVTLRFDNALSMFEKIGNIVVHRIGFTKKNPSAADLKKFPLHLNKYAFQFLAFWKALSLHRREYFDGIWAMMAHSSGVPAALFKLFHKNVFYILTLQEGDPPEYIERKARLAWPLFKKAFTSADYLIGESSFLELWGRTIGFKGESAVIPNGITISDFSPDVRKAKSGSRLKRREFPIPNFQKEELREKLKLEKNDKVLITTSRLVKKNAVGDIIEALTYLPQNVKLLILGDGPLRETLELQAISHKLQNRIHFLGFIESAEIPLYLKSSDIFVRPSLSEGMGNSFIEAMAAGIPVIGTAVGGIVDFLKHRETGFICEVKNPQSIAEQVMFILDSRNADMVEDIVKNARTFVEKKHNWDSIANIMKNVFKKTSVST